MDILRRQLDHRIETGTTTIRDLVPTFLTSSYTDRNDSSMDAAYHIALGAKHTNQTSSTGAAIAAGCTRVTRRISQPADNGISAGYSVSFEHAFLEDVCCPAYRVFNTAISCTTHDALSRRSYAGRALLPCLERSTNECHDSFSKEKHTKRDHCLQLAIFLSVGILHSAPITITPRAVFSEHQSHDHDLLLSAASDLGRDVGPLSAAALLSSWNLTHATTVPTPLALILARPPCLFNLTFWAENPGAGAFYIWLLPILLPELRHIRFVVSLTHCFKGGTGWRKYTSILTNDDTLDSRVGACGSCPHTNCGHSKRHEVIIGGDVRLPPDALNMKHSVPPALYDAELFHLLLEIPPDQRHHYAIVHMGSGSQSSMHISCHGFVVLTVDKEPTTTTKFRSVSPTLRIDYDSRPIMDIVALVAAKAGFHVDAVVGILFDPCCITRTTMTRMNRCHRYSDGQPFSARAYTRDVFDTAHILHFDYAVDNG